MIFQDRCKIHHAQVGCSRANGLESCIVRREHSDVHGGVEGVDQVSLGQSASSGAETSLLSSIGNILGDRQDLVDDVDDSACEVDILLDVSFGPSNLTAFSLTGVVTVEFMRRPE